MRSGSKHAGRTFVDFLLGIGQDRYDPGPKGESSIRPIPICRGPEGDGGYR